MPLKKAVFLDRDGTLIKAIYRPDFVKHITCPFFLHELEILPGSIEALKSFRELGYLRIMATNQPDVANGYMRESEWEKIHRSVLATLPLDDFFMCRHPGGSDCYMKKPKPGMLVAAADRIGIDLAASFMIGDTDADILAGKAAGCKTILLRRFYNISMETGADYVAADIAEALQIIRHNA